MALFAAAAAVAAGGAWLFLRDGGDPVPDRGSPRPVADNGPKSPKGDRAPGEAGPAAVAPAPVGGDGVATGLLLRSLTGAPIPGTVAVTDRDGGVRTIEIGANGVFVVRGLPRKAPLTFLFASPGLLPLSLPPRSVPADDDLDLSYVFLGEGQRLEVLVVDSVGAPVAGCALALGGPPNRDSRDRPPRSEDAPFQTASDEGGRAAFADVPPGTWYLRARARGHARAVLPVELVEGAFREPLRVVLGPGVSLEGRVLHADGRPAAAATLSAAMSEDYGRYPARATGVSDAEGRFLLDGLMAGRTLVSVWAYPGVVDEPAFVDLPAAGPVEIRLAARAEVRGKVVDDATGTGIEGAEVSVYLAAPDGPAIGGSSGAKSGPDGVFRFPDLPAIPLQYVSALKPGYLPSGMDGPSRGMNSQPLEAGAVKEVEVRMRRGAVVRGVVRDSLGAVVPVAWVRLMVWRGGREGMSYLPEVRSDEEGRYVFAVAVAGPALFEAGGRNRHLPNVPEETWEALRKGDLPDSCSVVIPESGEVVKDLVLVPDSRVEGRMVRADGKPAPGYVARLESADSPPGGGILGTASGPDGSFFIEDLAPAKGQAVSAYGPAGRVGMSDAFDLVESEVTRGVVVVVKAPGSLAGRVRRADGGPLEGAALVLRPGKFDPEQPWRWRYDRGDEVRVPVAADGAFRAEGLAAGDWTPVASATGCIERRGDAVALGDAERKAGVEIVLAAGMAVAGLVLDPAGAPVAGARVTSSRYREPSPEDDLDEIRRAAMLEMYEERQDKGVITDAEGRFRLTGLEAGPYDLIAAKQGFVNGVTKAEAGAEDVVLRLGEGLSIQGRVVEAGTGKPVPGVTVQIARQTLDGGAPADGAPVPLDGGAGNVIVTVNGRMWRRGENATATTAVDGAFLLGGLKPGSYDLQVSDPGEAWAPKRLAGVRSGAKGVVLETVMGLAISGRVEDAGGQPLETRGLEVSLEPLSNASSGVSGQSEEVGRAGEFSFKSLPPGRYRISAGSHAWSDEKGVYVVRAVEADAGRADVVIPLSRGKPISGRVLMGDGTPPKDRWVFLNLQPASGADPAVRSELQGINEDGAFTTDPLPDGTPYDIVAKDEEAGTVAAVRGVLPGSQGVVLRLEKGGTIRGKVLDPEGKPLPGATVWARGAKSREEQARGATDAEGAFSLEGLAPGSYRLYASADAGNLAPVEPEAAVAAGAADAVVRTSKGYEFRCRVTGADGKAAVDFVAMVQLQVGGRWEDLGWHASVAEGSLAVHGLPKCRLRVCVAREGESFDEGDEEAWSAPFEVPGEEASITLPR
jgi:protocatechuate 3,4-dioxygenase beta subunit